MIDTSVLVVGAGAIGGVTAANLDDGVRRVSVLDPDKEHVERMRDPGLLLDELGEERYVRLDAHADPSDFENPFDFALVTLKAPHLEAALGPLVERGLARTFVSFGNGLVQDRIAAIVGDENLIVGTGVGGYQPGSWLSGARATTSGWRRRSYSMKSWASQRMRSSFAAPKTARGPMKPSK